MPCHWCNAEGKLNKSYLHFWERKVPIKVCKDCLNLRHVAYMYVRDMEQVFSLLKLPTRANLKLIRRRLQNWCVNRIAVAKWRQIEIDQYGVSTLGKVDFKLMRKQIRELGLTEVLKNKTLV